MDSNETVEQILIHQDTQVKQVSINPPVGMFLENNLKVIFISINPDEIHLFYIEMYSVKPVSFKNFRPVIKTQYPIMTIKDCAEQ